MDQQLREMVWQTIATIPLGQVATYGQIASLCGYPGHARAVGHILRNLPADTQLPWHRVINAKGEIALPPDSDSYRLQKLRLQQEGIDFHGEKIRLRDWLWDGYARDYSSEN
ncbi:MGMT family protein [Methylophaga sp. OBS1]|uniref:MGMT family protein n=1 Tax=Methylophaga sp. OBS1 TaxID=2991933 RepID=UPI0022579CC4|nr:methylated-DNA--[protein]-cysteine S-methyltransferase [Methylophaga sp. OBS1]MCX4193006.1 methylated-DNA--[protein]-cysteine S-methyltransferase [Methylophaga sp. OBS1]